MAKGKKEATYAGGMILGTIPSDVLTSLEVRDGGDVLISHSPQASKFLKKNGFHKV